MAAGRASEGRSAPVSEDHVNDKWVLPGGDDTQLATCHPVISTNAIPQSLAVM